MFNRHLFGLICGLLALLSWPATAATDRIDATLVAATPAALALEFEAAGQLSSVAGIAGSESIRDARTAPVADRGPDRGRWLTRPLLLTLVLTGGIWLVAVLWGMKKERNAYRRRAGTRPAAPPSFLGPPGNAH